MIKAIIFDWGNVLIGNGEVERLNYFSKVLNVSEDKLKPVLSKYITLFDTGALDEETLWMKVQEDLGSRDIKVLTIWKKAWDEIYFEFEEMWEIARKLKSNGYKLALLSNTEKPTTELSVSPEYAIFDAKVFSCLEGVRKPDRKIYEITLGRLGVKPEEAVFIDDREDYVEGAKIVGLRAIHHNPENISKTVSELKSHGVKV